jgi:putative hydrolase of the HAD superfamily
VISTVLFDLDDTLVDVAGAARVAVLPWAAEIGVSGQPEEIARRWAAISEPHYRRYQRR